jgi:hypothetical protein
MINALVVFLILANWLRLKGANSVYTAPKMEDDDEAIQE